MEKQQKFLACVPFSGFYNSVHSDEIDREVERTVEYFREEYSGDLPDFVRDLWEAVDYATVYEAYAKEYVEAFLERLGLDGEFEGMDSPAYYNYSLDRVYANLTRAGVARIWKGTDKARLDALARQEFTSRSGFISHYNPDYRTWGRPSEFDHNQLRVLLQAYVETEQGTVWDSVWDELELMERFSDNGGVDTLICVTSPEYVRRLNAMDYLRSREARSIRTMDQWHAHRRTLNLPFADTPLGQGTA